MLLVNLEVRVYVPEGTTDAEAEAKVEQVMRNVNAWANTLPRWVDGTRVTITEI